MITVDEHFSAVIVSEDRMIPNTWSAKIRLIPLQNTTKNYNIALDRIMLFIQEVMDNSIILSGADADVWSKSMGFNGIVHFVPDDPSDHLMAIVLYTKINAILEGVFHADRIEITSTQGDNIHHEFNSEAGDMDTLEGIAQNVGLQNFCSAWYDNEVSYFVLNNQGLTLERQKWEDIGLSYESTNNVVEMPRPRFKPTIVTDNDDDQD